MAGDAEVATKGSIVHLRDSRQKLFLLFPSSTDSEGSNALCTMRSECVSEQRDLNLHERPSEINAPRNKSP